MVSSPFHDKIYAKDFVGYVSYYTVILPKVTQNFQYFSKKHVLK